MSTTFRTKKAYVNLRFIQNTPGPGQVEGMGLDSSFSSLLKFEWYIFEVRPRWDTKSSESRELLRSSYRAKTGSAVRGFRKLTPL